MPSAHAKVDLSDVALDSNPYLEWYIFGALVKKTTHISKIPDYVTW